MSKGASGVDHVDGMLPIPQLFAYGLQHVLAMYAGAVAVPIIIAQAMHLPIEDLIRLITADLFTCGVATLIQTLGFGPVGGRIPLIQGVTFASVGPMIMIGQQHDINTIYGAIIVAGSLYIPCGTIFQSFDSAIPTCSNRYYHYYYWYQLDASSC